MQTWNDLDKSKYPAGPWMDEPDKAQWVDAETGLDCLIVRANGLGHLCGYVGLPESHPLFGKDYKVPDASVHGGLTFADKCHEGGRICHVPEPGRPEHVWWFGFDCAHLGDVSPTYRLHSHDTYRDFQYVKEECESLARQLKNSATA